MKPSSAHFVSTMARYGRAMLNAVANYERDLKDEAPEVRRTEIAAVLEVARAAIAAAEKQLAAWPQ